MELLIFSDGALLLNPCFMKDGEAMRCVNLVAALVLVGFTGTVNAQWGFVPRFAPIVQLPPAEYWKEVHFSGVTSYLLDGCYHWVDPNGQHWRTTGTASEQVPNQFVEPFVSLDQFDPLLGVWQRCEQRVVRDAPPLPPGTRSTIQVGVKTHALVGDSVCFATWVQTPDKVIRQLWVTIEKEVVEEKGSQILKPQPEIFEAPATTETPASEPQLGLPQDPTSVTLPSKQK